MLRLSSIAPLFLALLAGGVQTGCRSCGTCYDYSPPVADCECQACSHGGRRGSALSHQGVVTSLPGGEIGGADTVLSPTPANVPIVDGSASR